VSRRAVSKQGVKPNRLILIGFPLFFGRRAFGATGKSFIIDRFGMLRALAQRVPASAIGDGSTWRTGK
jgi:hypothetical protein